MESLPQTIENFELPQPADARKKLTAIREFQKLVLELFVKGHDYGIIPGTKQPTLLKPGAEKTAKLLGLSDSYEIDQRIEDWENGFFHYEIKCNLKTIGTGDLVSQGIGSCNSMESKYRYRWVSATEAKKLGHDPGKLKSKEFSKGSNKWTSFQIANDDIHSQVNTILKMAKKRALVDAALSAGRLSDIFTQDLEDQETDSDGSAETEKPTIKTPEEKPKEAKQDPPPAQDPPANDKKIFIDAITKKPGKNEKGPYVKTSIRSGSDWFSTFSESEGQELERAAKNKLPIIIQFEQNGEYKNITYLQVCEKEKSE